MAEKLVEVKALRKYFHVGHAQVLHAVDDVSFTIERGKTLGMVGESGCGKTTVGRTLLRLYDADGGQVFFHGEDIHRLPRNRQRELARRMQMVFQDPYASLDPRKTVGAIIGEGLRIHKLCKTKAEYDEKVYALLEMVGLNREHASRFPHEFSGGQRQRVGIARALSVGPEFIVCDEAISALDVSIQAQVINLLMRLQKQLGLTYLFIAHDLSMVRHVADDVAVMYLGTLVETASAEALFDHPKHPYTIGLLAAAPEPDPDYEQERASHLLTGEVPSAINPKPGCRFCQRCPYVTDECRAAMPPLVEVEPGHRVACYHSVTGKPDSAV